MQIHGSSLARGAVIALSTMLPFTVSSGQDQPQEVNQKKEEQLRTQGFLIDFQDDLLLRDIKKSLSGLNVERIRVFNRPENKYYVSIKTAQLWKDLAKVISEFKGVEGVGTPPINPNLPDITDEFNCIGKKVHEPKYINPKDSSSKIQIQNGSALVVQTRSFATLPIFLDGTLKVRLEGDRCLQPFIPEEGNFFEAHKDPRVEAIGIYSPAIKDLTK